MRTTFAQLISDRFCILLQLSVPSSLNLLPGQIHMLKEAIDRERERIKSDSPPAATDCSPYISLKADMPGWVLTKLIAQMGRIDITSDGERRYHDAKQIMKMPDKKFEAVWRSPFVSFQEGAAKHQF